MSRSFEGMIRRRDLPHWDVDGKPVFITACLDGSVSASGLASVRKYRQELDARPRPKLYTVEQWGLVKHKLLFAFVDELLDHQPAIRHLDDPRQAKIVHDAIFHFADERYHLFAFVVMPSHMHWLFLPDAQWAATATSARATHERVVSPREIISHSIQSYTSTMCNRVRGVRGSFWQRETFDHWARDEAETLRIIEYIENNPVKAGLAKRPEEWPWSSARIRHLHGLSPGDRLLMSHNT